MSAEKYLKEIMLKGNLTMYALSKALNLKSDAHVWLWLNTNRKPNLASCVKIIKLAKKYDIPLTLDLIFSEELK